MKKISIVLAIIFISTSFAFGQCKTLKKTKGLEKWVPLNMEVATQTKKFIDKLGAIGYFNYVKSEEGDYFFIMNFTRSYSSRFEANEDTPLIMYLDDGTELIINPLVSIDGRMRGLTSYNIFLYYNLSKEQLELLASNYVVNFRIYFLAEKEISNSLVDDWGTYLEYDILSEGNKNRLMDGANCILQY